MHLNGYRVVGAADARGGVYNPDHLDVPKLLEHVKENHTVKGFPEAESVSSQENFGT